MLPRDTDLTVLIFLKEYIILYYTALGVIKTFLTILVIYMVVVYSPKTMQQYRYYILINIASTYFFNLFLFIWQPTIIAPNLIICSSYLPETFDAKFEVFCFFGSVLVYIAHLCGVFICLMFQYAFIGMSKLRLYFEKVGKVIAVYAVMIIVTAVPILVVIGLSPIYVQYGSVWTSELNATYELIYNYRQRYSCCFRLDISKTLVGISIAIVIVAGAFTIMFIYMHIDIYYNIRKQAKGFQQSIQTVRMQTTLYQAIIAQSVCITIFYVIPVFVSIISLFAELPMVSFILTGTVQTIFAYEFFNLVLTLYFIKPYRAQVVRSIMTFWHCFPSRTQTSAQQRTVHVIPLK